MDFRTRIHIPWASVLEAVGASGKAPDTMARRLRSTLMTNSFKRAGGCACGNVRFVVTGEPVRVGLCHCLRCRKAHGAAFNPFAVFRPDQVELRGELRSWFSSPGYDDRFCTDCGSRVISYLADEVEISLGTLDEPSQLRPEYESWVIRREAWLHALPVPQFERDRVA